MKKNEFFFKKHYFNVLHSLITQNFVILYSKLSKLSKNSMFIKKMNLKEFLSLQKSCQC